MTAKERQEALAKLAEQKTSKTKQDNDMSDEFVDSHSESYEKFMENSRQTKRAIDRPVVNDFQGTWADRSNTVSDNNRLWVDETKRTSVSTAQKAEIVILGVLTVAMVALFIVSLF